MGERRQPEFQGLASHSRGGGEGMGPQGGCSVKVGAVFDYKKMVKVGRAVETFVKTVKSPSWFPGYQGDTGETT